MTPRFVYGDLDLTDYPYIVQFGSDFGNPENVTEVVASLLLDGEVLEVNRRLNRVLSIPVLIDDADLQALAEAEARLIAEASRPRNTLTVDPGDGIGAATVFETFQAQPRFVRDDDYEQEGVRRIVLEIPALPHTRSVERFTDDADTPPSSPGSVVYSAESTTGWSKYIWSGGAAAAVDNTTFIQGTGSIAVEAGIWLLNGTDAYGNESANAASADQVVGLSIDTDTGGYLGFSVQTDFTGSVGGSSSGLSELSVQYDGGAWVETSFFSAEVEDGFTRYVFQVDAGLTITGFRFVVFQYRYGHASAIPKVRYDNFTLSTSATTDQSIAKTFEVPGSARGPGSLYVSSPDDSVALGQVLVATVPEADVLAGFRPDVRRWVTSGTATPDVSAPIHGSYYAASDPTFDVPVSMLAAGPYTVVALIDGDDIGVTAQLRVGGANTGPVSSAASSVQALSGWRFVVIGTVYLPPLPMTNPVTTDVVRIEFTGGASLVDAFLIPASADFSIVDCGSSGVTAGGSSSHLWIDSPDPAQPRGGWWRGPEPNRESARSAWPDLKKRGRHIFTPGRMNVYVVTTNAEGPRVTLDGFPWWFGNAAQ